MLVTLFMLFSPFLLAGLLLALMIHFMGGDPFGSFRGKAVILKLYDGSTRRSRAYTKDGALRAYVYPVSRIGDELELHENGRVTDSFGHAHYVKQWKYA